MTNRGQIRNQSREGETRGVSLFVKTRKTANQKSRNKYVSESVPSVPRFPGPERLDLTLVKVSGPCKHFGDVGGAAMVCPKCSKETLDGSKFCCNCGNPVADSAGKLGDNATPTKSADDLLLAALQDLGEEVRKRRDPEYIYTAAAVGSFGAVSWGVASLSTATSQRVVSGWATPASVAAIGTGLLAAAVIHKIYRDHDAYAGLRNEQVKIAGLLATKLGVNVKDLPKQYREVGRGLGYLWSMAVVLVAAIGAVAFCLSVNYSFLH